MNQAADSTVSFRPIALATANKVDSRGLPRGESARYKLSRSIPACLATLASPPRFGKVAQRQQQNFRLVGVFERL